MIRRATPRDAAAIVAIYIPFVRESHFTFETETPTEAKIWDRMEASREIAPWLVWEEEEEVLGYACAASFRDRPAYRWSVEASVYVRPDAQGRGIGRALCEALVASLRDRGYRNVLGVVALPNDPSIALLERAGFRRVGVLCEAGYKFGAWWDVGVWQLRLAEGEERD